MPPLGALPPPVHLQQHGQRPSSDEGSKRLSGDGIATHGAATVKAATSVLQNLQSQHSREPEAVRHNQQVALGETHTPHITAATPPAEAGRSAAAQLAVQPQQAQQPTVAGNQPVAAPLTHAVAEQQAVGVQLTSAEGSAATTATQHDQGQLAQSAAGLSTGMGRSHAVLMHFIPCVCCH